VSSVIQPISEVAPELVKHYLAGTGVLSPELVEWKYYDYRFNQGRERGYVWLHHGQVRGFVGLIPFRIVHNRRELQVAWSCDCSLDQQAHLAVKGILLLRESLMPYDYILCSGGDKTTHRIFSQIALSTIPGASLVLHAPMGMRCFFPMHRGTLGPQMMDRLERLSQVLLRRVQNGALKHEVTTEPGVSSAIAPLLQNHSMEDCPLYDFEYLHWQIGRCPTLESHTMYIGSGSEILSAVLLWCSTGSRDFWRMAVFASDGARDELESLTAAASSYVYKQGGAVLSIAVSRHDSQLRKLLRARGFIVSPRRRSLYILSGHQGQTAIPEPRHLSFLDTDWAYRLPVPHAGTAGSMRW
jgi:hypothetical protein